MSELAKFLVESILEEGVKDKVVVYSGRFQPFHKGHYASYIHLVDKFGRDNVYIATSDKTDKLKSPFNFKEKQAIITKLFGIPKDRIIQVKNPYTPVEVLKNYDKETTAYITAVGGKDAKRLGGKYFEEYDERKYLEGYEDRGYVYITPMQSGAISGTQVRHNLRTGSEKDQMEFFKKVYPKFDKKMYNFIVDRLKSLPEVSEEVLYIPKKYIEEWFDKNGSLIHEISNTGGVGEVDDGPNYIWTTFNAHKKVSKQRAEQIGYEVIGQIMDERFVDIDPHPIYPDGPVQSVSTFPAGVAGKLTTTNQQDFETIQAYDTWQDHVTRAAGLVGYSIIEDLLDDDLEYIKTDELRKYNKQARKEKDSNIVSEMALYEFPMSDLKAVDSYADKQFKPVDVVLTHRHFFDRLQDPRNKKPISQAELVGFFKRLSKNKDKFLEFLKDYGQIVAKDKRTNINIPFMKKSNQIIAKTVMRKKDFQTSNLKYKFESLNEAITKENITNYYKRICKEEGIKPIPIKFKKAAKGGAYTSFNPKTKKPIYIGIDVNRVFDIEMAILHELTHQIMLEKYGDAFIGKRDKNRKFTKVENYLVEKYMYSDFSEILYKGKMNEEKNHDYAIFKLFHGKKNWLVGINKNDTFGRFDSNKKFSDKSVLKFSKDKAINLIDKNKRMGERYGIVRMDGKQILVDNQNQSDGRELLLCGGAYGHMNHPFETDINLTFGQLKDIVDKALEGELEFTREKCIYGDAIINTENGGDIKIQEYVDNNIQDKVLAYNEETGENEYMETMARFDNDYSDEWLEIELEDGKRIQVTPNHRIYVEGMGYVKAEDLSEDINLKTQKEVSKIKNIKKVNKKQKRYDLKVDGYSCYYANGILVHNTDGYALSVSWIDGKLKAARNKSHLKNRGANAMDIKGVADKFRGRGELEKAYNFAMQDLERAIGSLSDKQREKIFKNGSCFMNLEVIYPTSVNVIPYGQALLIFHGTMEYDENGNPIGENEEAARILAGMINQVNKNVQKTYTIQGPPITKIPKTKDLTKLKPAYKSKISKLQKEFGLKDSDGVTEYHKAWWSEYIDKTAPERVEDSVKEGLVNRWVLQDKSFRLNGKNIENERILDWAKNVDKQNHKKLWKENLMKFEDIFLGVGAEILSLMSSALTLNQDKATQQIKKRVDDTIKEIEKGGDPKHVEKLKLELRRLEAIGGVEKIVPIEGIVFSYKGHTMKLSGSFAAINQILGIMYR